MLSTLTDSPLLVGFILTLLLLWFPIFLLRWVIGPLARLVGVEIYVIENIKFVPKGERYLYAGTFVYLISSGSLRWLGHFHIKSCSEPAIPVCRDVTESDWHFVYLRDGLMRTLYIKQGTDILAYKEYLQTHKKYPLLYIC